MSRILHHLRSEILKKNEPKLIIGDQIDSSITLDITEATHLKISNELIFDLNSETEFYIDSKPILLKSAIYSWLNQNLSAAEFVTDSQNKNIQTLTFLQRTDLINWLNGSSKESEFIRESGQNGEVGDSNDKSIDGVNETTTGDDDNDPFLKSIQSHERDLIDHNTSLRGFKDVDFSNVGRECEIKLIKQLKRKGNSNSNNTNKDDQIKKRRLNPIILISPAASALISMTNIKTFFEESLFVDPNSTLEQDQQYLSPIGDIRNISHVFPKVGKQTFLIVNNTDKFTKPEYWERVVAVITTGQNWQFKNYKWSNPKELFQKIKGYYFYYNKDVVPKQVKDWNVEKIPIDKHKRFKDVEVLNNFWDSLEKSMISKGWGE